jgi:hypothetical protein
MGSQTSFKFCLCFLKELRPLRLGKVFNQALIGALKAFNNTGEFFLYILIDGVSFSVGD